MGPVSCLIESLCIPFCRTSYCCDSRQITFLEMAQMFTDRWNYRSFDNDLQLIEWLTAVFVWCTTRVLSNACTETSLSQKAN